MQPLRRAHHPEPEELWPLYDDSMSFVPNSLFTMARRPEILGAFSELITRIWRTGTGPAARQPRIALPARPAAPRRHWDEGEIGEILAVIGLFVFLNRWNDSMATDLEEIPGAFAGR